MKNTFGQSVSVTIFGESHGEAIGVVLDGLAPGIPVDRDLIDAQLTLRRPAGRISTARQEPDHYQIVSGAFEGHTTGTPLTIVIPNTQTRSKDYAATRALARPGHADLTGYKKYARQDVRDILERSSARETTMRVAVGAVCKQFLKAFGMKVVSHVTNIGGIAVDEEKIDRERIGKTESNLNCCDAEAEEKMKSRIREAKESGDTLGGIFEVVVRGVPLGLGSHIQWDRRLDARLAGALMSIQAIKGVEIGAGFACADLPGSQVHDEMYLDDQGRVYRKTNRAGGLEGGMSNGEDIVLKAVMKPIPTLMQPLHSVDVESRTEVLACKERSDTCAVSAASVVGEAMTSFVMAQALCEKFGSDDMVDVLAAFEAYGKRVRDDW